MRSRLLAVAASVVMVSLLAGCGGSDEDEPSAASTSSAAAPGSGETDPGAGATAGECAYEKTGDASKDADLPPATPISVDSLTIATNRGEIKATLTPDTAPCTVSSFASLAKQGYFDGTKCHRLVADELKGDETYPAGTLAMANAGPDTNGSQFFIVLADADLPPSYTVFGTVDAAGLKVAQEIEAEGNGADGVAPAKDVILESVS
jgi:peptidyl-prolyl cis-trans isomerase B (cyclophilin B)